MCVTKLRRAYVLQAFATSTLIVMPSLKKDFPKPTLLDICAYYFDSDSDAKFLPTNLNNSKQHSIFP